MRPRDKDRRCGFPPFRARQLILLLLNCAVFVVPAFLILFLQVRHMAKSVGESLAQADLRNINIVQDGYAEDHPDQGFACDLSLLKLDPGLGKGHDWVRQRGSAIHHGYQFVIGGCKKDASGRVTQYAVTAVPLEKDKTGSRAFCTNESRQFRFYLTGSAAKCLSDGTPLF